VAAFEFSIKFGGNNQAEEISTGMMLPSRLDPICNFTINSSPLIPFVKMPERFPFENFPLQLT
jgi:hypothetical protein